MRVAVIPARGGSKRIPKKNIRDFMGRPIISRSIEVARKSGCFDRVIVSTDCPEIERVALDSGAEVPFERPAELADDFTTTIPVVRHAIKELSAQGKPPTLVCCIYATAPFLLVQDLTDAFERQPQCDGFLLSVTEYRFPIQRALRRQRDGRISMFQPEHSLTRSQDLEKSWHDAGQFYLGDCKTWLSSDTFFHRSSVGIVLPNRRVQDIDTLADWEQAELMFEAQKLKISEIKR